MAKDKLNRSDAFTSILSGARAVTEREDVRRVPLTEIRLNPNQPRKHFDEMALMQLVESIREKGVLQPVLIRNLEDGFELVAGERRYRAAQHAGLETLPAVVRDLNNAEALEVALVENLSREDLNAVEETDSILRLLSIRLQKPIDEVVEAVREGYYQAQGRGVNTGVYGEDLRVIEGLFSSIGRFNVSSFYTHRLSILRLPEELLAAVREGWLEYSKAKVLAGIADDSQRAALLKQTKEEGLSRKALQGLVRESKGMSHDEQKGQGRGLDIGILKRKLSPKRIEALPQAKKKKLERLLEQIEALLEDA